MMGRILAIPDCYSAMTTDRPYRKGFEPEQALAEIERCKGTQFDPYLATLFIRAMRRELEQHNGNLGNLEGHLDEESTAPAAAPSDGSVAPQLSGTA
jgi:HD-GYP domain-containing protein (c-di-GMP phosphodiesterase class II)